MEDNHSKKLVSALILVVLLILAFFVMKSILISVIAGLILAFIFSPLYSVLFKTTKSPNLSASLITILLILIVALPLWFFTPTIIQESLNFYNSLQKTDFISPLTKIFPSIFASQQFSREIGITIHSFITNSANSLANSLGNLILNFPSLILQLTVLFFVFYFVLRDGEKFTEYLKSILPFSKENRNLFFRSSKEITGTIIYGVVIIGAIQGIFIGISFFIFKASNPFILTLLAIIVSIIPAIPTVIVWVPVVIHFITQGNVNAGMGVLIFGILSIVIENLLRPILLSKRVKLHSSVLLVGMIGGMFPFGIFGIILGPLILSYLIIILEVFRSKNPSNK